MNNDLLYLINKYTVKQDSKMKEICAPLENNLGIFYFLYYFLNNDGGYGFLTNDTEYTEYYYGNNMHLTVPYYAHPSFFRSGYVLSPCSFGEDYEKTSKGSYTMDHLFMELETTESGFEGFCYYNRDMNLKDLPSCLEKFNLFTKFKAYFKREAAPMIRNMRSEPFNMQEARGKAFLDDVDESFPLSNKNAQVKQFLKNVYKLSAQEERCLKLFQKGYSAQATGAIMGLSRRTVESYFNNIKEKLNCSSKWELLDY